VWNSDLKDSPGKGTENRNKREMRSQIREQERKEQTEIQ
jgi:hypothetical protein